MEDKRCCGSGTCIINAEGVCWCGQRWDGEKMISANSDNKKPKKLIKASMESSIVYIAVFVILIAIFILICVLAFLSKQPNKKKLKDGY